MSGVKWYIAYDGMEVDNPKDALYVLAEDYDKLLALYTQCCAERDLTQSKAEALDVEAQRYADVASKLKEALDRIPKHAPTPAHGYHCVIGSNGLSLRMTDHEKQLYDSAVEKIEALIYKRERDACGIWASNQGKYVQSLAELNDWDSRKMEELYQKYYASLTKG